MTDLAERPTQLEAGDDTQHLNAIFGNIKGYRARIADLESQVEAKDWWILKQEQEITELRAQLQKLQRGEGIMVIIEGRSFSLGADGPTAFDPASLIAPEVRDELSQKLTAIQHSSDSFVL
jgi:hypothetical protein